MKPTTRSSSLRSRFGLLALALSAIAVSSCRTTEGFGRDMQHLGNKIENSAERHL
ncbi:MAG: entericidin A/B family lipoprotein [Verrucomicrobiota bacterium]|jgi:predicted small secreted protein